MQNQKFVLMRNSHQNHLIACENNSQLEILLARKNGLGYDRADVFDFEPDLQFPHQKAHFSRLKFE